MRPSYPGEESGPFLDGLHAQALEIDSEANVGVETGGVLVEVHEGLGAPIEDAPLFLDKAVYLA